MFDRENAVGLMLLGLCVAAGAVLLYSTLTDTTLRYTGPGWLAVVLGILFIGALLYGLVTSRGRWPDPLTGRGRGWWLRWRRRRDDEGR